MGTSHGSKLADLTTQALQDRLADPPDDPKAVKKLVAALAYKDGESVQDIEDTYGWPTRTVYRWLDHLEERGLDDGLTDQPRSGRPAKLSDEEREEFFEHLQGSPGDYGYERQAWLPSMARDHLASEFGVVYSLRHVRRLMHEAGLTWRTARPQHYQADEEEQEAFREAFKKTRGVD